MAPTDLERTQRVFETIAGMDVSTPAAVEAFAEIMHPEMTFETADLGLPDEDDWVGRDAVVRGWSRWLEQWDDYQARASNFAEHEGAVLLDAHVEVRGRGSGVPLVIENTQAWSWRDGKLVGIRVFTSREAAESALAARTRQAR